MSRLRLKKQNAQAESFKKLLYRTNEQPLLFLVCAFQIICMALLTFKTADGKADIFSLRMLFLLPFGTYAALKLVSRMWPIDRALFLLTAFLCSLSVITLRAVFTTTSKAETQALYLPIGFAAMLIGICVSRTFMSCSGFLRAAMLPCLALMALPLAFTTASAARSWVKLGTFQFQPSELLKPATALILASEFSRPAKNVKAWLPGALFGAALCAVLLVQRDLGALFLFFILTIAMFTAGTGHRKTALCVILLAGILSAVFVTYADRIQGFSYLSARMAIWRDPWNTDIESARQIRQGLISIASGGLFGSGLGLSSARKVAVVGSDYIFAAVSEEFGMIFALGVIAIYFVILLRGRMTALSCRNRFQALLAFGCAFELTSQMLLIVMGNLHITPLTGVTLPFVSEGGSSLAGSMLLMGMLLGVGSINAQDEYDDLMRVSAGRRAKT